MRNIPTIEEKFSLPIISQIFPDVKIVLKDKPDVQSVDGSWGIEVVSAVTSVIREALNIVHNGKEIHDKEGYEFSLGDGCGYIIKTPIMHLKTPFVNLFPLISRNCKS